jgi:hypothetical protein
MFHGLLADQHHVRRIIQTVLHLLRHRFKLPATYSSFSARCALGFQ